MTPDLARKAALAARVAIHQGDDPAGDRQQRRREATVAVIADRYLVEHVAIHNKVSTGGEIARVVERLIKPGLGSIRITDLSRADIKAWHQRMSAAPYQANRALAYLSKMLSLTATDWELREDNPAIGIKRFPERYRERFYSIDELARIGDALATAEREGSAMPGCILLIRLLATTGMRLGEVLSLQWSDADLPGRSIRLRDAKAGARTVHLGAGAIAVLDAVPDQFGYVVHGADPEEPLSASTARHTWMRLRDRAQITNGRLHDLRHSVGTYAALAGANAFAVRDLLGHRTLAMTGRYVERAADMVRSTADAVSNRISAALNAGTSNSAEIVRLRKPGRAR